MNISGSIRSTWCHVSPGPVGQSVEGQFEDPQTSASATITNSNHQHPDESPLPQSQANAEQASNGSHEQPSQAISDPLLAKTVSSALNPHSKEFVPQQTYRTGSGLNISAEEFVPQGLMKAAQPPSMPLEDVGDSQNGVLSVSDILQGYERRHKADTQLLTSTATMLLEVTMFPGTHDIHAQVLTSIVRGSSPGEDELLDLAEMLLSWVS